MDCSYSTAPVITHPKLGFFAMCFFSRASTPICPNITQWNQLHALWVEKQNTLCTAPLHKQTHITPNPNDRGEKEERIWGGFFFLFTVKVWCLTDAIEQASPEFLLPYLSYVLTCWCQAKLWTLSLSLSQCLALWKTRMCYLSCQACTQTSISRKWPHPNGPLMRVRRWKKKRIMISLLWQLQAAAH